VDVHPASIADQQAGNRTSFDRDESVFTFVRCAGDRVHAAVGNWITKQMKSKETRSRPLGLYGSQRISSAVDGGCAGGAGFQAFQSSMNSEHRPCPNEWRTPRMWSSWSRDQLHRISDRLGRVIFRAVIQPVSVDQAHRIENVRNNERQYVARLEVLS